MKKRKLGFSDLHLTEIGFGAWAVGGGDWRFGWGPQDDQKSIQAIQKALDLGINWIDTAAIYGLGHSEKVVGKALAGIRSEVIVATKCSQVWNKDGEINGSLKSESVIRECEDSLRRLETDFVDIYQIHWPSDEERIEEGWGAIEQLIKDGKVRFGGVSNFRLDQLERAQSIHPIASLQPPYSMLRRSYELDGEFEYCKENNIGIVAYSPIQCGLLTDNFNIERVAKNDWRRQSGEFRDPNLSINISFAQELKVIAQKYGKTVSQLAIAWVLRKDEVTSAIVGARSPEQIEETIRGAGWKIEEEDLETIDEMLAERLETIKIKDGFIN